MSPVKAMASVPASMVLTVCAEAGAASVMAAQLSIQTTNPLANLIFIEPSQDEFDCMDPSMTGPTLCQGGVVGIALSCKKIERLRHCGCSHSISQRKFNDVIPMCWR